MLPSAVSYAGCVSGLFFSSHNPPPQRRPVRRLQNKMVLTAEGARALCRRCRCSASPPPPQMVLITRPLEPVLCQLVLAARLPPSFVWWFEGGGLASLYAYLCIRVCVRRWKDEEIVRRNWKDRKSVPISFFSLLFPARSCATAPSARITKTHVCRLCFQAVKPKKPSLCRRPPSQLMTLLLFHHRFPSW